MAGAHRTANATAPAHGGVIVTKSDATVLPVTRGLYIGGAGDVNVRFADQQQTVLFSAVPVGTILPIQVDQVLSTNTTATLIVALY